MSFPGTFPGPSPQGVWEGTVPSPAPHPPHPCIGCRSPLTGAPRGCFAPPPSAQPPEPGRDLGGPTALAREAGPEDFSLSWSFPRAPGHRGPFAGTDTPHSLGAPRPDSPPSPETTVPALPQHPGRWAPPVFARVGTAGPGVRPRLQGGDTGLRAAPGARGEWPAPVEPRVPNSGSFVTSTSP